MKIKSVLKPKHVGWVSGVVLVVIVGVVVSRFAAKPSTKTPSSPVVEVATVEQRDVPVYGEWIGTLAGQVNADVKAQITCYLLKREYKEGSYVRKGQLLFEIDPRPVQAALDQAKGQLAQAQAQLVQNEAQLATAKANQLKSQLDVEKYGPLAKVDEVSKQDFDNATQTDLANQAQVQAAQAAIAAAKAQIQANQAAVETAAINLGFTRIVSPIDGIVGIAQAQVGDLVSTSSGPLTTVSTLDPIRDYFTVSEQEYLALQKRFSDSGTVRWNSREVDIPVPPKTFSTVQLRSFFCCPNISGSVHRPDAVLGFGRNAPGSPLICHLSGSRTCSAASIGPQSALA